MQMHAITREKRRDPCHSGTFGASAPPGFGGAAKEFDCGHCGGML
jgi:hypothetical protein